VVFEGPEQQVPRAIPADVARQASRTSISARTDPGEPAAGFFSRPVQVADEGTFELTGVRGICNERHPGRRRDHDGATAHRAVELTVCPRARPAAPPGPPAPGSQQSTSTPATRGKLPAAGAFAFPHVLPGRYLMVAIDSGNSVPVLDRDSFAKWRLLATGVTLVAGQTTSAQLKIVK
jgi:hypothetical protein